MVAFTSRKKFSSLFVFEIAGSSTSSVSSLGPAWHLCKSKLKVGENSGTQVLFCANWDIGLNSKTVPAKLGHLATMRLEIEKYLYL